jgi:hypothetical protein
MLERVSLLTNKKWYLEVCKYYGDKVLRGSGKVRVISIVYGMHRFMLRVFNASANGLSRKF